MLYKVSGPMHLFFSLKLTTIIDVMAAISAGTLTLHFHSLFQVHFEEGKNSEMFCSLEAARFAAEKTAFALQQQQVVECSRTQMAVSNGV